MTKELLNLGKIYPSDFLAKNISPRSQPYELKLVMDADNLVHLEQAPPADVMWGQYFYRSSINEAMKKHLHGIVSSTQDVFKLSKNDTWLDIACNDGCLLSFVPKKLNRIGIDPADDSFYQEAILHADTIIQDYFSADVYKNKIENKAKIITVISMFYDLQTPNIFLKDVYDIMDDNGLLVIQVSYTPLMLRGNMFDNICHEHFYYYSFFNLNTLLENNGFKVMDCELNDCNGGSVLVYAIKESANVNIFSNQIHRDVADFRVSSIIEYEKKLGLGDVQTWTVFKKNIDYIKDQFLSFAKQEIANGKKIYGYGASTKGNTTLQYYGLDSSTITAIADRSTYKHGLFTVGTNIPIISEEKMREDHPDYLLILPHHFLKEFKEREKEYLSKGGKMIVISPKFEVI